MIDDRTLLKTLHADRARPDAQPVRDRPTGPQMT